MSALDRIGELELLLAGLYELTQQLVDLSNYPGQRDKFNALDAARIAVEGKIKTELEGLEHYVRYGLKEKEVTA